MATQLAMSLGFSGQDESWRMIAQSFWARRYFRHRMISASMLPSVAHRATLIQKVLVANA
jgi:hypothetical protein